MDKHFLNELFEYKDGNLYWKVSKGKIKIGDMAGSIGSKGYKNVTINYKNYRIHRIIFLMHHNYLPEMLDHINGNRLDNRIENLRECTLTQNNQNRKISKTNTSGIKNVRLLKGKWRVDIRVNGIKKYFGSFDDIETARLVAEINRSKYHGDFAKHI